MIASPSDYPQLDVEQEWAKLHEAVIQLERTGRIVVERLERSTLSALQQRLRRSPIHIFHFIGHGGFDPRLEDGLLVCEDDAGRGRDVSGEELGGLLTDHDTMRLAVLNACEGARADLTDPFAGVAQSLIQQGLPAVVAMQFEITDQAAITFARELYAAVADSYPLDAALAEARKAIRTDGNLTEWGTPVLYSRAPDGRIFDLVDGPTQERPAPTAANTDASRSTTSGRQRRLADTLGREKLPAERKVEYNNKATAITPALVIWVLDMSQSMATKIGGQQKINLVTRTLISIARAITLRSMQGTTLAPRYRVAIYAYHESVRDVLGGIKTINELIDIGVPAMKPSGPSHTARAFEQVERLLRSEHSKSAQHDSPAPLVCHFTDGDYRGDDPLPVVRRIQEIAFPDGGPLVENIYFGDDAFQDPIADPYDWHGVTSVDDLATDTARHLFRMSSPIPKSYGDILASRGYTVHPNARFLFPHDLLGDHRSRASGAWYDTDGLGTQARRPRR